MGQEYSQIVLTTIIEKMRSSSKPLTESEIIRSALHLLKIKLGKSDRRHTSKERFRREVFKPLIQTKDWSDVFLKIGNDKYILKDDKPKYVPNFQIDWSNLNRRDAIYHIIEDIHRMAPETFEKFVSFLLKTSYPAFEFEVTPYIGDGGIDVKGSCIDKNCETKTEVIYVQAKNIKGKLGRPEADKFIGAVSSIVNDKSAHISKFLGIFISSGTFTDTFENKLSDSSQTGITYICWDGSCLADKILALGMGIRYSKDKEFWEKFGI